jgi:hypothetical protein
LQPWNIPLEYDFESFSVIVVLIDGITVSVNVIRCAGFSFFAV